MENKLTYECEAVKLLLTIYPTARITDKLLYAQYAIGHVENPVYKKLVSDVILKRLTPTTISRSRMYYQNKLKLFRDDKKYTKLELSKIKPVIPDITWKDKLDMIVKIIKM